MRKCYGVRVLAAVVALAGCHKNGGDPPPVPPIAPTQIPRAAVSLSSTQGSATRQTTDSGYDYTFRITVTESGGATATFNAWDFTFLVGGAACGGAVHLDSASLTTAGASIAAGASKVVEFKIADAPSASLPLCTSIAVTVTYSDAQGGNRTASSSGGITAPVVTSPPTPTPAAGRYKCSGNACIFDSKDNGPNQCTPGGNTCTAPTTPAPSSSQVTMTWSITNTCGVQEYYKFFDETNNLVWPSSSTHYSLTAGNQQTHNLSCVPGANICPGGGSNADGAGSQWGVGIKNNQRCADCCDPCKAGSATPRRIVCTTSLADLSRSDTQGAADDGLKALDLPRPGLDGLSPAVVQATRGVVLRSRQ